MKLLYSQYMVAHNAEGSNKASSYVRALELLGPILASQSREFHHVSDVWMLQSLRDIDRLYYYILEQQKLGDEGIFDSKYLPSYWRNRFYSAALKSYKEFLVLYRHEIRLWDVFNRSTVSSPELSQLLNEQPVESIEELVADRNIDFSTKEGKDLLREVKTRVNQHFFRKMILKLYGTQCCVSGLNIPEVLRASHILSWADDEENRLNPANGICLSATYDAAFDSYLISFDDDFRMILSPTLKEYYTNHAFKTQFQAFEGNTLSEPQRFSPDKIFLAEHRNRMSI